MRRLLLSFSLAVATAASLSALQHNRPRAGQSIFIVAARDSRMLTVCPSATEVKTANGSYWESDRKVMVQDGPYGLQLITLMESHAALLMPAPGGAPAVPPGTSSTLGVELDRYRLAPDAAVKKWLEQEFVKQKTFTLVDSAETADFVFVAEAFWRPVIAMTGDGNALSTQMVGDWQPNLLQGVLAFAVPGAAYRQHPGDVNALLAARAWEGSVFCHRSARDDHEFRSASSQDLVKAFHRNARPANDHPPICAASNHPFSLEGVDAHGWAAQRAAKADPGEPAEPGARAAGRATFRSGVTYVTVPLRATDASGEVVDNLQACDLSLREDGVDQQIDRLIPIAEPFDVAVLVDTSASMRLQMEEIQTAILALIDTLRPADRVMPVSFNDRITAQSDFLADHSRLRLAPAGALSDGQGRRHAPLGCARPGED